MDDSRVCAPLLAESDAQNDTSRTHNESSVTDADKVINTNIDSTKFEGEFCQEHANTTVRSSRPARCCYVASHLRSTGLAPRLQSGLRPSNVAVTLPSNVHSRSVFFYSEKRSPAKHPYIPWNTLKPWMDGLAKTESGWCLQDQL